MLQGCILSMGRAAVSMLAKSIDFFQHPQSDGPKNHQRPVWQCSDQQEHRIKSGSNYRTKIGNLFHLYLASSKGLHLKLRSKSQNRRHWKAERRKRGLYPLWIWSITLKVFLSYRHSSWSTAIVPPCCWSMQVAVEALHEMTRCWMQDQRVNEAPCHLIHGLECLEDYPHIQCWL